MREPLAIAADLVWAVLELVAVGEETSDYTELTPAESTRLVRLAREFKQASGS